MLRFLRKRGNLKKIMWALAILIIPAFVLWGSGSAIRSKGLPKYAGKIFGKKVSLRQYEASLLAFRNQALLVYGEDFDKLAKFLDLDKEAWERLILLYQAKKERVKVTDKEVIDFIEKLPLFQKEGRFNQERYNILLDYAFHTSPRDFEEQIRGALKIGRLKDKLMAKVLLSDEEIENVYKNENEKARALYVLIEAQKFTEEIHPAYEELQDYYQSRKSEFKKPEQVNVQYIALYFDQAAPKVLVSEEEMLNYYQQHSEQFSVKDKTGKENIRPFAEVETQVKERLTREKVRVTLEEKIWQISDQAGEDPASFEEVAKGFQLDVKETDFFGPQQVIAEIGLSYEFLNAAFTLEVGEVSKAIETPKGYFIIKVKEKKQAYLPGLEEIREELSGAFVREKSWQLAKNKAEELLAQMEELMEEEKLNFSKAAEKASLAVKETEEFSKISYISGIGQSREFAQAAFALEPGETSDLIRVPNGYSILSLKSIVPIDQEKFAQEKEEFAKKLLARKKDIFYKIWLTNLKKKANLVNTIGEFKSRRAP
jgi:peptidyl-prolyl cis-trans isomerase D